MFNKVRKQRQKEQKEIDKQHEERLARCIPVARECLNVLLSKTATLPMGDDVQFSEDYYKLATEFLTIFLKNNINWSDREFILQLAMQPFEYPKNIALNSIGLSWDRALTGVFGKPVQQLTMVDVDKLLRKADVVDPEGDEVVAIEEKSVV